MTKILLRKIKFSLTYSYNSQRKKNADTTIERLQSNISFKWRDRDINEDCSNKIKERATSRSRKEAISIFKK